MASDNLKSIIISLVLFAVISALITGAVVGIGALYDKESSEIGGGALDNVAFQQSVDDIDDNAEVFRQQFESGDVDDVDDPSGIFSIAGKFVSFITTPFTLLSQVLSNIFDIPSWVVGSILGLLSISLILALWRLVRTGD